MKRLLAVLLCLAVASSAYARHPRGSAAALIIDNTMGLNLLAANEYAPIYEGFPLFKNRVRETLGFASTTAFQQSVPLSGSGWPTTDFQVDLFTGTQQSWSYAPSGTPYTCGFIGTGSETITVVNNDGNASITNISHGMGGAYTTFDLVDTTAIGSAANYGFKITGTTGGVTDDFCYLPEYPGSTIDDPISSSAFTTEAITFYSQFKYLRLMWYSNALYDTRQETSTNINTASNTQTYPLQFQGVNSGGETTLTWASEPGNGATSGTLSANWADSTGTYMLVMSLSGTGYAARPVTLTNGSSAVSWSVALPAAVNSTSILIGKEGPPIAWMVAFANAANIGLWINLPAWEDGTNGGPGSYSTAVLQYLASNYTGSGQIYFERGNENFWNTYPCTYVLDYLLTQAGDMDAYVYMAAGAHQFANLARTYLPAGWWGTKAFQVEGQQAANGNGPYYTGDYLYSLSQIASGGNPANDTQYIALAPYLTPTIASGDSVATIFSDIAAALTTVDWGAEQSRMVAQQYGVQTITYEGGIQWNAVNQSNPNLGSAIMNSGLTTYISQLYQLMTDDGFAAYSHFGSGVSAEGNSIDPGDELSTSYSTLISSGSPTLAGIQPLEHGQTPTRNVVSGAGSTIPGYTFADNLSMTTCSFSQTWEGTPLGSSWFVNGNCPYSAFNPTGSNETLPLSAQFSGASGSPTTNVVVNGATIYTGIAVSDTTVSLGSITLVPGWNFIVLGDNSTQTATITELSF